MAIVLSDVLHKNSLVFFDSTPNCIAHVFSFLVLSTSFAVTHPTINNTWIDGGANTLCVDNATGLLGPRFGYWFQYWTVPVPAPAQPTPDDCKIACSKAPGCLAINYNQVHPNDDPAIYVVCMYLYDSVDSCMAHTAATHTGAQSASAAAQCWSGTPGVPVLTKPNNDQSQWDIAMSPQVGVVRSYKATYYTQVGYVPRCYYLQLPPTTEDKCSPDAPAAATATLNISRWASIAAMLEGLNLAQYAAQLSDEGYDDIMDDIASLTGLIQIDPSGKRLVDELTRAGVKKGHAVKVTNSFFATK